MTKQQVIDFIKNFEFIEVPHIGEFKHPQAIIQYDLKAKMIHQLGANRKDFDELVENLEKHYDTSN